MRKIKLALVDDHIMLRKSLAVLISMLHGYEIVMQAANGHDFISQLAWKQLPDIVLMDIAMPGMDGIETTRWLKQRYPAISVIGLSMIRNELMLLRMFKNGAKGFLPKDADPEELSMALQQVYIKGYYYNEVFTPKTQLQEEKNGLQPTINERELIFLRWACTEKSHKQIASEMRVSPRTVDGYRDALFKKLNVYSRVGLVLYALRNEIVQL